MQGRGGFAYHITPTVNVPNILSAGLRPSRSGLDGPGVYVFRGPLSDAVREADLSLTDSLSGTGTDMLAYFRTLSILEVTCSDEDAVTVAWPEYFVFRDHVPADRLRLVGSFLDTARDLYPNQYD